MMKTQAQVEVRLRDKEAELQNELDFFILIELRAYIDALEWVLDGEEVN
jgi:hypothetical protein